VFEWSTEVVKLDIKVINASLTQNKCLQCVTPPLTHVEISRPRDATELNNDAWCTVVVRRTLPNQTDPNLSDFSEKKT